jgi:hypothetical protein
MQILSGIFVAQEIARFTGIHTVRVGVQGFLSTYADATISLILTTSTAVFMTTTVSVVDKRIELLTVSIVGLPRALHL